MADESEMLDEADPELMAVFDGLGDGNLLPLASFLRSGRRLPQWIADNIADMIEGEGYFFDIAAKSKARNQRISRDKQGLSHWRLKQVRSRFLATQFEHEKRLYPERGYDSNALQVAERYGVGKTAVADAHAELNASLVRLGVAGCEAMWQRWLSEYPHAAPGSRIGFLDSEP